ncbi:hypothetical protein Tco_0194364 [Tanacetum coccineum]
MSNTSSMNKLNPKVNDHYNIFTKESQELKWTAPTLLWKCISGLRKKKLIGVVRCITGTATYGKIWCDEDVHNLISVETEFPGIVFNDALKYEEALSREPTPTVSYFDDLDFFKDFKNEFPAIVYNDALTSKLDFLIEPIVSPQHINEFNLKDETSLSECDKEEQNVLYFNDLFPFNVIYPDDSKSNKHNDDHEIDIKQSSRGSVINTDDGAYACGSNKLLETSHDKSNKFFKAETFIKELNVNIMTWDHLTNGMSFILLIKN